VPAPKQERLEKPETIAAMGELTSPKHGEKASPGWTLFSRTAESWFATIAAKS
jgi:hypothetical protein